jgi:hypothetical protein
MLTDTQMPNMRNVLHQIYVNLYIEFGKNFAHFLATIAHESFSR